jgi:hypothetical protein
MDLLNANHYTPAFCTASFVYREVLLALLVLLLLPAFLLFEERETGVFFNSSPTAESLRCRMLPIKTVEQRNPRLSIFSSTLLLFSPSRPRSGLHEVKSETR